MNIILVDKLRALAQGRTFSCELTFDGFPNLILGGEIIAHFYGHREVCETVAMNLNEILETKSRTSKFTGSRITD